MQIEIDYTTYRAESTAFSKRERFLVLHYTAINFDASVKALTTQVSAHYLVPDPTDPTYIAKGFEKLKIFNLVNESDRAWHAGVSNWRGRNQLNDTSIGIEIVNLATDDGGKFYFPSYHPEQITATIDLVKNIIQRYPDMTPTNIVAHSDISIGRKSDPGAAFPWEQLYKAGIGAWYDEATKQKYIKQFSTNGLPSTSNIIEQLKRYGYSIETNANTTYYQHTLRAFQLHFRACDYSGKLDIDTVAILYALIEKYYPRN